MTEECDALLKSAEYTNITLIAKKFVKYADDKVIAECYPRIGGNNLV